MKKADDTEHEREVERDEGLDPKVRGSAAAPSDKPENHPPHPQDVNDISSG
jgi:hypothetical protein